MGVLLAVLAVVGRFIKEPSITLIGQRFQASTVLIAANTLLLLAVFMHLMARGNER
jgi:hypothetical protein